MIRRFACYLVASFLAAAAFPAAAQSLLATVPVGVGAYYLATNPTTNRIYVANYCGSDQNCGSTSPGSVTVIDGASNHVLATITVGVHSEFLVINPVTNKIYVTNRKDGTVSVINGATNAVTKTITVGANPVTADVDTSTNKIYIANTGNGGGNTVSVIDGRSDTVTATVTVGLYPISVSVNSGTHKIYVANYCGADPNCGSSGTMTVIDGATNHTSSVNVEYGPGVVLQNTLTNKIYVMNSCGNSSSCFNQGTTAPGTLTVVDGSTLQTQSVTLGNGTGAIAVNPVANQIYASNGVDNTATFIDGATLGTSTVSVGTSPADVEVNPVTNKIYVANNGSNTETVIDGVTHATTTVNVGSGPGSAAVNPVTNRVYVSNLNDFTVSVLSGAPPTALQFVKVAPCRLVDTRNDNGPFGGPPIQGGTSRSFPIPQQTPCNIPSTAAAYSLNVTLVPLPGVAVGFLTIWPTGELVPASSTMNSWDGRFKANAAIIPAGYQGAVSVYASNTTNVVLDIDGYFEPANSSTLAYYPLTPCRVADTRWANGNLGGPYLRSNQQREFPILQSHCGLPDNAEAYSFNITAVPRQDAVWVVTAWPSGQSKPTTSTLNAPTGTVVANAAILPAGTGGDIDISASDDTDITIDVNGYFAAPASGGLSLYPLAPCRVLDTRSVGNGQPFNGLLTPPVDVVDSVCGPPSTAEAYVFNATLIPAGGPVYVLNLWPDGEQQNNTSVLNAFDGAVTSNMALVPTTNGSIDANAYGLTQLILDISSYFAP